MMNDPESGIQLQGCLIVLWLLFLYVVLPLIAITGIILIIVNLI